MDTTAAGALVTPFEVAIIALLSPVLGSLVTLLGVYIKDLTDRSRLSAAERARAEREGAAERARAARAKALADELAANTALTQHAVNRAEAAYTEANNFNGKLAQTNKDVAAAIVDKGC